MVLLGVNFCFYRKVQPANRDEIVYIELYKHLVIFKNTPEV